MIEARFASAPFRRRHMGRTIFIAVSYLDNITELSTK